MTSSRIEEGAGGPSGLLDGHEEVGGRGEQPARAHHGLEDDGGDLLAPLGEDRRELGGVAVRRDQGLRALVPVGADLEVGRRAVVAVAGHEHQPPTGGDAGDLDRHHRRLAARVGEPQLLDRGHPGHDLLGQGDGVDVAGRPVGAVLHGPPGRGDDRRVGVAVHQAGEVADEVQVAVAVDVGQPRALAPDQGQLVRRVVTGGAGVASWHDAGRGRGVVGRPRRPLPEGPFDGEHGPSVPRPV